jgi:hypothetical protein
LATHLSAGKPRTISAPQPSTHGPTLRLSVPATHKRAPQSPPPHLAAQRVDVAPQRAPQPLQLAVAVRARRLDGVGRLALDLEEAGLGVIGWLVWCVRYAFVMCVYV